jgi:glycine cleavage system H protein
LLGVTTLELQTIDSIERVELPEVGAELRQGGALVGLLTTDGLAHNLWSPLGGRVLSRNDRLRDQPESLRDDPEGTGWIARILPVDLSGELPNLIES